MPAHAGAVKDDGFAVDGLVCLAGAVLHDDTVEELIAANVVLGHFFGCCVLGDFLGSVVAKALYIYGAPVFVRLVQAAAAHPTIHAQNRFADTGLILKVTVWQRVKSAHRVQQRQFVGCGRYRVLIDCILLSPCHCAVQLLLGRFLCEVQ